jgi:hypothetical protein
MRANKLQRSIEQMCRDGDTQSLSALISENRKIGRLCQQAYRKAHQTGGSNEAKGLEIDFIWDYGQEVDWGNCGLYDDSVREDQILIDESGPVMIHVPIGDSQIPSSETHFTVQGPVTKGLLVDHVNQLINQLQAKYPKEIETFVNEWFAKSMIMMKRGHYELRSLPQ